MTRGTPRRLDYRFLGDSPDRRWWAPLDDLIISEGPGVVVRGGANGTGVFLSGIPSMRRDVIGTLIRYTVVVDDPDPALLDRLVRAGLNQEDREKLGARLDAAFPAEYVDGLLSGHDVDPATVDARLAEALDADADHEPSGKPARPADTSWAGASGDPDATTAFRQRAAQLAAGELGWAFTTAALSSEKGVRRAVGSLDRPAAVLVDEGWHGGVVELGKDRSGPPATPHGRAVLVGVLVLVVLAVLVLAVMLLLQAPSPA